MLKETKWRAKKDILEPFGNEENGEVFKGKRDQVSDLRFFMFSRLYVDVLVIQMNLLLIGIRQAS